jgi:hypothetical protein
VTGDAQYTRDYRARHGGLGPGERANKAATARLTRWAKEQHPEMWATLLAEERSALGLGNAVTPSGRPGKEIVHGTRAGWSRHRHRGETPCEACQAARSAHDRARRSTTKGAPDDRDHVIADVPPVQP